MNVNYYKSDIADPKTQINPVDVINDNCSRLENVLRYFSQLKPKRFIDYVIALEKRLSEDIKGFSIDYSNLLLDDILSGKELLNRYPDLRELMIQFVFHELKLPKEYVPMSEKIEVALMDWLRASNIFRYHRVKAIVDIMDRTEGIDLWKDMVYRATQESLKKSTEECHPPVKEITEGWMKEGETGNSNFELTIVSFDDHKVALRFDRCPVFDSVKHLEDREIAYLSYCWTGQPEQELNKKARRKNTPQTLYHSDYCVEFYWDNDVHPDAKPPTTEFWSSISKSKVSQ